MTGNAIGSMAVTVAGARYANMLNETCDKARERGDTTLDELLAVTYLRGLYDMAALHTLVKGGTDMAECLTRIDGNVQEYLSGKYKDE